MLRGQVIAGGLEADGADVIVHLRIARIRRQRAFEQRERIVVAVRAVEIDGKVAEQIPVVRKAREAFFAPADRFLGLALRVQRRDEVDIAGRDIRRQDSPEER